MHHCCGTGDTYCKDVKKAKKDYTSNGWKLWLSFFSGAREMLFAPLFYLASICATYCENFLTSPKQRTIVEQLS